MFVFARRKYGVLLVKRRGTRTSRRYGRRVSRGTIYVSSGRILPWRRSQTSQKMSVNQFRDSRTRRFCRMPRAFEDSCTTFLTDPSPRLYERWLGQVFLAQPAVACERPNHAIRQLMPASVRLGGLNGDFETAIERKRSCHKAVDRIIEILK